MFFKNNFSPAFASASPAGQAPNGKLKKDSFTFETASETDDFGSFSGGGSAPRANGAPRKNARKNSGLNLNKTAIIIAAAAVALLVLIALIVGAILIFGSNGNVVYENNAYVSFSDADGVYRVAVNGEIVGTYENPVEVITAADRSFAYIIESSDEGKMISIVEGKKVKEITEAPISKVLATATLKPAVVWLDETNGVYHYSEKQGENRIVREYALTFADTDNHNFCISADGETVVYTQFNEDKGDTYLYVYEDTSETRYQKNMYPVAVSDDGSLIYAYASRDGVTQSLYVIPVGEDNDQFLIAENFRSIVDFNIKGNEIVYTAWDSDSAVATFLVAFNLKKMDDEITPTRIIKGAVMKPMSIDGNVARFETFKDTYFECDDKNDAHSLVDDRSPVYYVDKKFKPERISYYNGQFDPDGDFYYYINPTNNANKLQKIDLRSDELIAETITEDVEDFAVTGKGNLYILTDDYQLRYYNVNKEKSSRISDNVVGITMHKYTNTLYFNISDTVAVYCTEEGSSKEQAKFDGNSLTGLPYFVDTYAKKNFVGYFDEDNEEWRLFYTSNGKKFTFLASCEDVAQFYRDITIGDVIDGIIDGITGQN